MLWRQFDRLGPPYPSRLAIRGIRDTARAFFDVPGVAQREKALAAYIVGNTFIAVNQAGEAMPWLQRAVALDPTNKGYRSQLDSYQGQAQ